MVPQRPPHLRAPLLVVGLLMLLVAAAAGIALALRPAAASVPLDPGIPNEQALIARGLSGMPSPGQPATPIAVDRVVTDGAATYVQFHSTGSLGRVPDDITMLYYGSCPRGSRGGHPPGRCTALPRLGRCPQPRARRSCAS